MKPTKKGELCYKVHIIVLLPRENCVMQRAFVLITDRTDEVFVGQCIPLKCLPLRSSLKNGSVDGVVIRVDDVTERENDYEQEAKHQAEQSDKLKLRSFTNMIMNCTP